MVGVTVLVGVILGVIVGVGVLVGVCVGVGVGDSYLDLVVFQIDAICDESKALSYIATVDKYPPQ